MSARTKVFLVPLDARRLKRRSKPMVVPGFSLIPAPPQSEPPMWPGQTSAKSSEREQALSDSVQPARALLLVDREVGPGDVADEERVAGHEPGLVAPACVGDQVGGVLRPVPGRRERGDRDVADAT